MNKIVLAVSMLLFGVGCTPTKTIDGDQLIVRFDFNDKRPKISDYMFGMFLEHLGNVDVGDLIDDGIWAEVLDDRKFFYPVDTLFEQSPINKRDSPRQWMPVGCLDALTMDSVNAYVGVHSPKITVDPSKPNGIMQGDHSLLAKSYNGRIILRGDEGIIVSVRLYWGDQAFEYSEEKITGLSSEYKKYDLHLICQEITQDAKLIISGVGEGSFNIGAVSIMPEDNIYGFRADAIKLLKELNSRIYRWGGNMSSGYNWRDGVGNPDERPSRYDYAWNALENNDVGTHELIKFAELINVEINLTVNAGLGGPQDAADWVEYTNGSINTPMGKLRAQNGHTEPFNLKIWCIGNESYGWWQLGHTDIKSYVIKHNQFAKAMKAVDPTIELVASGATEEEMLITGNKLSYGGDVYQEFVPSKDWSGSLLANALENIDYMSEHFYCSVTERFDIAQNIYIPVDEPLIDWTRRPANRIRAKARRYREIYNEIPGSSNKKVYLDEWAYYTNWVHPKPTLSVSIGYARALHEMFRNTDIFVMSGHTFGTSCLSFNETEAIYNTTGLMFKLYQSRFGRIPVTISGNSLQPSPKWPIGGGQPETNAGGNTYPLDIVAALTEDGTTLSVAIINPTEKLQMATLVLPDYIEKTSMKKWLLSGISPDARNIVGMEPQANITTSEEEFSDRITAPAASISIYHYNLK